MTDPEKARGLYTLYRDEKKHEERTKRMLQELEKGAEQLQAAKMVLVEKLLDLHVKDEVTRQERMTDEVALGQINAEAIRDNARKKIEREVKANIDESRRLFHDGFVAHLDKLVHTDDTIARNDIQNAASQYVDPHIEMMRRSKRTQPQSVLQSVVAAASQVAVQRRRELEEQQAFRVKRDAGDRIARVEAAEKMLRRGIGDLTPLLFCQSIEYKTGIGKREAEINDLRVVIQRQKAEEERLLQERQIQLSIIDSDQAKLVAEVELGSQKLVLLQRELETKELDLKEMASAQLPGSGTWATNTMQLERDLSLAVEEEFHLRHENEEVRKTLDILETERAALDTEVADSIRDLSIAQQEFQSITAKIEQKLSAEKAKLYEKRGKEQEQTRQVNESRYRILYRREDVRRQKRDLRAAINATISQLSIEDRMQSALMARSIELQKSAEKARAQADHHVTGLNNHLLSLNSDLQTKTKHISALAEQLANFYAGVADKVQVPLTATQLQTQIDQLINEWYRVEWEAASTVAQVASRIDFNSRQCDKVLRDMGGIAVMQEDLAMETVDVENSVTTDLQKVRDNLYSEASQRAYREAKYTQIIRMMRERLAQRARGDVIQPLTKNRRLSHEDRRARREAAERSKAARQIALEHLKRHNENSEAVGRSVSRPGSDFSGVAQVPSANQNPEFRMMVINFIKKEIQPLYDTNQLTKKRFIDIVARVSTWFLDTHKPVVELSETNVKELVRRIQETITWQDQERLNRRE